jgi:Suppressor of fused protein (SUFU)
MLLAHLERGLGGRYAGAGITAPEWNLPFSAFRFVDRPETGVNALTTFGLSSHAFTGADGMDHHQEILLTLRSRWDDVALQIIASLGAYMLDGHRALVEGETIAIPRELKLPLDFLVAAKPDPFAPGLGRCGECEPEVEIVWLLPYAADEEHVVTAHGWRDLVELLEESGSDGYDLARTSLASRFDR